MKCMYCEKRIIGKAKRNSYHFLGLPGLPGVNFHPKCFWDTLEYCITNELYDEWDLILTRSVLS